MYKGYSCGFWVAGNLSVLVAAVRSNCLRYPTHERFCIMIAISIACVLIPVVLFGVLMLLAKVEKMLEGSSINVDAA